MKNNETAYAVKKYPLLEPGCYIGKWSGFIVSIDLDDRSVEVEVNKGIKCIGIQCNIIIEKDGEIKIDI